MAKKAANRSASDSGHVGEHATVEHHRHVEEHEALSSRHLAEHEKLYARQRRPREPGGKARHRS